MTGSTPDIPSSGCLFVSGNERDAQRL